MSLTGGSGNGAVLMGYCTAFGNKAMLGTVLGKGTLPLGARLCQRLCCGNEAVGILCGLWGCRDGALLICCKGIMGGGNVEGADINLGYQS